MHTSPTTELSQFAEDVLRGMSSTPKQLSSKYFYDDEGTRVFQEIMRLPEYYPTRAELGIFQNQAPEILEAFISAKNDDRSSPPAGGGVADALGGRGGGR